ncbi:YcxB-like protein [Litoreibacter meonggei]|uniref:YcxB-like protein n=1 Tax=Litoreibacter meonggei TaxID=1049199 RepID=A0A497X4Z0_9RHOB|nr:YcxB family protein [Litoreibacter meonggei]RLJ60282.1 YcxB-like protein [Litoreibacter meonggei]
MTTLTYQIDEAEFMHAARAFWSYRGIGDLGNWLLTAFALIAGTGLLIWGFGVGWIWIGAGAVFPAITLLRNFLWRRAYRKMIKYSAPITASFTSDEVQTKSAEGQSQLPWTTFTKYAETPDYFFLLLPRRGLSIIPKRACKDDWEIETLRDTITANLPRAKMRWT